MKDESASHLGIDPGADNFAMVMLDRRGRVCYAAMLRETISSMKVSNAGMRPAYRRAIARVLRKLRPDVVLAEQFAARRFGTQSTEVVNLMLGALGAIAERMKIEDRTTLPSTWKNALNRVTDLEELYAYAKKLRVQNHPVDALCLAAFSRGGYSFRPADVKMLRANVRAVRRLLAISSPEALIKKRKRKKRRSRK